MRALAALFPNPARTELWLTAALLAAAVASAVRHIIFAAISFTGGAAALLAAAVGAILAVSLAGLALRIARGDREGGLTRGEFRLDLETASGIGRLLSPLAPASLSTWPARALWAAALAGAGCAAAIWTAPMDWNYLFQKLSALAVWTVAFAGCYGMAAGRAAGRSAARDRTAAARASARDQTAPERGAEATHWLQEST